MELPIGYGDTVWVCLLLFRFKNSAYFVLDVLDMSVLVDEYEIFDFTKSKM